MLSRTRAAGQPKTTPPSASLRAISIDYHALVDVTLEPGMDGLSDGLLKWQIQSRFPEYQDQPKTISQNLSLRLMSPEQREEEAGRILLRIAPSASLW